MTTFIYGFDGSIIFRPNARCDYRAYVRNYICQSDVNDVNYKEFYNLHTNRNEFKQMMLNDVRECGTYSYSNDHKYLQCVVNGIVTTCVAVQYALGTIASYFV